LKRFRRALTGLILCEDVCAWGLALSVGDWRCVYLLSHEVSRLRQSHLWGTMLDHLIPIMTMVPTLGALPLTELSIVLLEGSTSYLQHCVASLSVETPLLLRLLTGEKRFTVTGLHWLRLQHSRCGGVTSTRVQMGFRGLPECPLPNAARRSLSHVLQSKERPRSCPPSGPPGLKEFYKPSELLHPTDLNRPVLLPTYFSATGWGVRCLTLHELACAFDIPLWIQENSEDLSQLSVLLYNTPFPPVLIGACILHHYAPMFIEAKVDTMDNKPPSAPLPPSSSISSDQGTYFPDLDRYLPHSWIGESLISDKAVKAEDAEVIHRMWDARIVLVLP
jgi:hypothetical protein